jgi:hypothetical protein
VARNQVTGPDVYVLYLVSKVIIVSNKMEGYKPINKVEAA